MHCSHCQTPVEPGHAFCSACGRSVTDHGVERPEGTVWDSIITKVVAATAGKYRLERVLGQGGMAAVYLAQDLRLDRPVAVKIMAPSMMATADAAERFRHEAITVAKLKHQHIVTVYAVEEADDVRFIIMEFVQGASLEDVLRRQGRLPHDVVRAWLQQTADALDSAHRRGIVHRDVKPANILIDDEGDAVLTDFGIAKAAEGPKLTQTGMTVGTPTYMSPEQCASSAVTEASDQYSLGIVAYEMLAGAPPFSGPTLTVLQAHLTEQPAPILNRRPDCPADLAALIERMLAKDASHRWPSLADVAQEVRAPAHGRATELRRRMIALVSGGAAAGAATPPAAPRSDPEAETVKFDTGAVDDRTAKLESGQPSAVAPAGARPRPRPPATRPLARNLPPTKVWVAGPPRRSRAKRLVFALAALGLVAAAGWYGYREVPQVQRVVDDLRASIAPAAPAPAESTATGVVTAGTAEERSGGQPPPPPRAPGGGTPEDVTLFSLANATLAVGDSIPARATTGGADPSGVTWEVERPDVVTIADGWMLAIGPGETGVTAATGGRQLAAVVTVTPVEPRFARVTAGATHTCGATRTAEVYCWGRNHRTQVRARIRDVQAVPLPVHGSFAQVAAGGTMTCALEPTGLVQCWGDPMRVPPGRFQFVAAGLSHACALAAGGGFACWGDNRFGQLGMTPSERETVTEEVGFVQVASGDQHNCGLTAAGRAFCWGDNRKGQTGVGGPISGRLAATAIGQPTEVAGEYDHLVMLTAGTEHTCAVTRAGTALCWGGNDRGQLGDGTKTDRTAPRPVTRARGGAQVVFHTLAAGGSHTCGVTANERLYCWGGNDQGQVGDGTTEDRVAPVLIDLGGSVADVSLGTSHTCAVTAGGETLCWGSNEFGQLGDGSRTRRTRPVVPGRVAGGP